MSTEQPNQLYHKPEIWPQRAPKYIDFDTELGNMSLIDMLKRIWKRNPQATYLYFAGIKFTYEEIWNQVRTLATELNRRGVKQGDFIAILMPNTVQFVVSFFAGQYLGCICSLLNPLHVQKEFLFMLNDSDVKVLLVSDFLYDAIYPVIDQTSLKLVVTTSIGDVLPSIKAKLGKFLGKIPKSKVKDPKAIKWTNVIKKGSLTEYTLQARLDVHDVALLIYTGGTTGFPKGAMLTHRNITSNALCVSKWTPDPIDDSDRFVGALPFFHSFGLGVILAGATFFGSSVLLIPNPRDIKNLLAQISKHKATYFGAVPTLFIAILNVEKLENYDLSSIKFCLSGAAPLPVEVQKQFETLTGSIILEGYGMTELSPIASANPPEFRKPGSVGIPLPNTDIRIVDVETAEPLSQGEIGEIIVAGPQVMKGYWNRPEETAEALKTYDDTIFMHTGDIGYFDNDGFIYIVDRKKDMIIVSGYKVFPRDIEEVLFEHPAVANAAVIGIPDDRTTERVKAFIVPKEGHTITENEILEFSKQKLGKYKVPKEIEIRSELPISAIGKVLRRELRSKE